MHYDEFIKNILETRGRFNCGTEYHERHHIIPKCMGGTDDKNNLIDLYAKEHFIAHKLLVKENPDNLSLIQAYNIMAFTQNKNQNRYELTPEEYEEVRKLYSQTLKEKYKNKTQHPCYGTHLSEERKKFISEINKNNKYCVGRVMSQETREKIGNANRNPSQETRQKMSENQKKRNLNGGRNPRARKIIRLSDLKVYDCIKDAAVENDINYSTLKTWVKESKQFMYYDLYINKENNKC